MVDGFCETELVDSMSCLSPVDDGEVGIELGTDFALHVPELKESTITLGHKDYPEERVRIKTDSGESRVEYRSSPSEAWEVLISGCSRKEAARKAASVQEFEFKSERDEQTGLQSFLLSSGESGIIIVSSKAELPLHVAEQNNNPFQDGRMEFLLGAPTSENQPAIEHPHYVIRTRNTSDGSWNLAHTTSQNVKPEVAVREFSNVAGFSVHQPDANEPGSVTQGALNTGTTGNDLAGA